MKNETARREIESLDYYLQNHTDDYSEESHTAMMMAVKALEQEPCEDAISRTEVIKSIDEREDVNGKVDAESVRTDIVLMQPVNPQPKIGYCRDCKWWKDTDGVFRRGIEAESQCPMNRIEVYEGNGYCYMFEPQESEG